MNDEELNCVLCEALKEKTGYNYPLLETDNFVVLSDRLPIAEYHFIIVSKKHYINIWNIVEGGYEHELQEVIDHVNQKLSKISINKVLVFEHGQYDYNSSTTGKSIEHFHLHIVAEVATILNFIKEQSHKNAYFRTFSEMIHRKKIDRDYLMIYEINDNTGIWIFYFDSKVPSQYLRRVLYKTMNDGLKLSMYQNCDIGHNWKQTRVTISKDVIRKYLRLLND